MTKFKTVIETDKIKEDGKLFKKACCLCVSANITIKPNNTCYKCLCSGCKSEFKERKTKIK